MATTRQHRKMVKAIIQYTNSYEVSAVNIMFTLCIIKEWRRMRNIHLTNWQIQKSRVSAAAGCLHTDKYSQRRHPNHRTFTSLEHRVRETGHMLSNMTKAGRPWSHRGTNVKDVLCPANQCPGTSSRRLARHQISQRTLVRVLYGQLVPCIVCSSSATTAGW
jgi:hypothetical protein